MTVKEALGWSAFWIALGLAFSGFISLGYENHWLGLGLTPDLMTARPVPVEGLGTVYNDGASALVKYVTGYLVEKSLAVDNIFVISMIFTFFAVPAIYQHRVIFWGILGALILRGMMIAAGARMIQEFSWIIYVFGGFLILTGIKMLLLKEGETDPNRNLVVRATRSSSRSPSVSTASTSSSGPGPTPRTKRRRRARRSSPTGSSTRRRPARSSRRPSSSPSSWWSSPT